MPHELDIIDGKASMAYTGETPWHGLGVRVPQDCSPEQMLRAANLDWSVEKLPLFYEQMEDKSIIKTNARALVRSSDNKLLTIVNDTWKPVQNSTAFEFFNDFVAGGDMYMHTAGALREGKMVWALAQVNESFEIFGGDKIEAFLLFSNPHEFGRSIEVRFTPIRVVCNNTLTLALGKKSKHAVKINHRSHFNGDMVKETLGVAKDRLETYKQQALFLGSKKFKNETIVEYFNRVFPSLSQDEDSQNVDISTRPISRQAEEAMAILHVQPGANFAQGSWWQAFNTVTYMADHTLGRSRDTRLSSSWFGLNQAKKNKALELAVEYAKVA